MYQNKPIYVAPQNGQLWGLAIEGYQSIDEILNDWQNFTENQLVTMSDKLVVGNDNSTIIKAENFQQPILLPKQIPAIGFNYPKHMKEMAEDLPSKPNVFNKFVSSLAGPVNSIHLSGNTDDWESELVIVIGNGGRNISREDAEDAIAGYMVGQDLSDRTMQSIDGPSTQFDLAKSYQGYSPIGPYLTTADTLEDIINSNVTTKVNGKVMQQAKVGEMVFDIQTLISYISSVIELYPGDLLFTGTPSGTGVGRDPQVFLQSGDVVTSEVDGLGTISTKVI